MAGKALAAFVIPAFTRGRLGILLGLLRNGSSKPA
jgi:hypothetical protein